MVLLGVFWFASRYPQLLKKAQHVGQALPSMAFSSQLIVLAEDAPLWQRVLANAVNWLDSMKIRLGTPPKYFNARRCPARNVSVHSRGSACTKIAPEYGSVITNNATEVSWPFSRNLASP